MHHPPTLLYLCLLILSIASCGPRPDTATDATGRVVKGKAAKVVKNLEKNAFETEWLEGSARLKVESPKLNIGGSAVIRLHRDEAIWVSVKKFGFEGGRALIRPDSFFVQNRLSGEYLAEPLSYIEKKYKIPARFDLLQEIVLGNAVFMTRDLELETAGNQYVLTGRDTRYATRHVAGADYKLQSMQLTDLAQDRKLFIDNAGFRPVEDTQNSFPYERTVRIEAGGNNDARVDMSFNKLALSGPLDMPFRRR